MVCRDTLRVYAMLIRAVRRPKLLALLTVCIVLCIAGALYHREPCVIHRWLAGIPGLVSAMLSPEWFFGYIGVCVGVLILHVTVEPKSQLRKIKAKIAHRIIEVLELLLVTPILFWLTILSFNFLCRVASVAPQNCKLFLPGTHEVYLSSDNTCKRIEGELRISEDNSFRLHLMSSRTVDTDPIFEGKIVDGRIVGEPQATVKAIQDKSTFAHNKCLSDATITVKPNCINGILSIIPNK